MPIAPIPLPGFSQSSFAAFFSYAHADSEGWNDWVNCFGNELKILLAARLRGTPAKLHVSGDNSGAQSGVLWEQLQANLAASFAMFLFVHENYVESEWCHRELKHFKDTFGEAGFRERLYIVVMSEAAWERLWTMPRWRELFPFDDQRRVRFFRLERRSWPLRIYSESPLEQNRRALLSPSFQDLFFELLEDLVEKIEHSNRAQQTQRSFPELQSDPTAPRGRESTDVLVFIENSSAMQSQSRAIGNHLSERWDQLAKSEWVLPPPPMLLRPTGLPMEDLRTRPRLGNADGVILLWASKTSETLAEEIRKLEPSLKGRDEAPGLIAYPVASAGEAAEATKIAGWRVVRFVSGNSGHVQPVDEDADLLDGFLQKVLNRKKKRLAIDAMAAGSP